MKQGIFFICLTGILCIRVAAAEPWNLPADLTPTNTSVEFEVDSTWHLVRGTVREIEGTVRVEGPEEGKVVQGRVVMPIRSFDTTNSSRDKKLRKVMHAETVPSVVFTFEQSLAELCRDFKADAGASCRFELAGELGISGVVRPVVLQVELSHRDGGYSFEGETTIRWRDFGVEDPSILIARVAEEVKIHVTIKSAEKV